MDNRKDRLWRDVEHSSDDILSNSVNFHCPDFYNVRFGQLRVTMSCAAWPCFRIFCRSFGLSILMYFVLNVIKVGSDEKMIGIDARGIIAGMQHLFARRNGAEVDFPRSVVCADCAVIQPESAVFHLAPPAASPKPASFWVRRLVNLFKETLSIGLCHIKATPTSLEVIPARLSGNKTGRCVNVGSSFFVAVSEPKTLYL